MRIKLTRKHRKGAYDDSWYSEDGTIEVRPAYAPSIRGGSCKRRTHWVVITAERSWEVTYLDSARDFVQIALERRAKEVQS